MNIACDPNQNSHPAAVKIYGNGKAVIELEGTNTLQSGKSHAGIEKNDSDANGSLEIRGTGSLTATGGIGGAGIGGGSSGAGSNITITVGTVTATGGEGGSGIGGGISGTGSNITITGGTVTATGGEGGSGIGGGTVGTGSYITITNGTVTATGGTGGSGIGGGTGGTGSYITITNGTVTATGGTGGSGIGGGERGSGYANITISNGARVMAAGGSENGSYGARAGAAIGTGGNISSSGAEIAPNTYKSGLYDTGYIKYYPAGTSAADMKDGTVNPVITVTGSIMTSKTITFDANGGRCDITTATTVSSNGSQVLSSLPEATREDYRFDGWFSAPDGGNKITTGYAFTSDMTVYAHWEEIPGSDTVIDVSDNKPMAVSSESRGDFKITYAHEIPFYGKGKITPEYFGGLTVSQDNATYNVTKIKVNKKKLRIQITGLQGADKDTVKKIKKATKGNNGLPFKCNPYYVRDTDKTTPKFNKKGELKSVKILINNKYYKAKKGEYSYDSTRNLILFKGSNLNGNYNTK